MVDDVGGRVDIPPCSLHLGMLPDHCLSTTGKEMQDDMPSICNTISGVVVRLLMAVLLKWQVLYSLLIILDLYGNPLSFIFLTALYPALACLGPISLLC